MIFLFPSSWLLTRVREGLIVQLNSCWVPYRHFASDRRCYAIAFQTGHFSKKQEVLVRGNVLPPKDVIWLAPSSRRWPHPCDNWMPVCPSVLPAKWDGVCRTGQWTPLKDCQHLGPSGQAQLQPGSLSEDAEHAFALWKEELYHH